VLIALLLFGVTAFYILPTYFNLNPMGDVGDIIVNIINPPPPSDGDGTGDGDGTTPPPDDGDDHVAPPNNLQPSSLTAFVSPNPMTMGGWIQGTVSSDGYNWPITIYATHKGEGATQSWAGLLAENGIYQLTQQLSTPGIWSFVVKTAEGLESNTVTLTCQGILIVPEFDHYSKTFRDSISFKIYSHMERQSAQILANFPAGSYTIPVTNIMIASGGFATFSTSLDSFANGDYQWDVIIGSASAIGYGGE